VRISQERRDTKLIGFAMLSFIREQGLEDPSGHKPPAAGRTATDGPGDLRCDEVPPPFCSAKSGQGGQEYLTVAARGKNVRKSTVLLAGLFILGLFCLLFMIKKSSPQEVTAAAVSTEETQIEMAITGFVGVRSELFNRMSEIVKKFYEFSDVQQIKVNELVKNPFKHEIFLSNLKEKSDTEKRNPDIDAEIMGQQLRQQTKNMQLLSIMITDTTRCCMIDDRILYEGDSIGGFNVRQIGDSTVLLESEDVERERGPNLQKDGKMEPAPNRPSSLLGTQIILKLSE